MNIVMIYSFWWNILWNWFNFCRKESKGETGKSHRILFCVPFIECAKLSHSHTHMTSFCVSSAYHSSLCMYELEKQKKTHSLTVGMLMELLEQPGAGWVHKITIIFTTRQACKTPGKPNQTKPNQWLLYLHVTGKIQLTSSLVASGDWGRRGAKKWVGFGREKRERGTVCGAT